MRTKTSRTAFFFLIHTPDSHESLPYPTLSSHTPPVPMRLLTHNVLRSPMKGVVEGYPLRVEATDVQVRVTACLWFELFRNQTNLHLSNRLPHKGGDHSRMTCFEIHCHRYCVRQCHPLFTIEPRTCEWTRSQNGVRGVVVSYATRPPRKITHPVDNFWRLGM